jgi:hypothetical protein
MAFTSVDRDDFQKAFVTAHRHSENPQHTPTARAVFRLIAKLIWQAHGEQKAFPTGRELDDAIARGAETSVRHETPETPKFPNS